MYSSFYTNKSVHLTKNDLKIIRLICKEYSVQEISILLFQPKNTVLKQIDEVARKIGARN